MRWNKTRTLSDSSRFNTNSAGQTTKQVQRWQAQHSNIFHSDGFAWFCGCCLIIILFIISSSSITIIIVIIIIKDIDKVHDRLKGHKCV